MRREQARLLHDDASPTRRTSTRRRIGRPSREAARTSTRADTRGKRRRARPIPRRTPRASRRSPPRARSTRPARFARATGAPRRDTVWRPGKGPPRKPPTAERPRVFAFYFFLTSSSPLPSSSSRNAPRAAVTQPRPTARGPGASPYGDSARFRGDARNGERLRSRNLCYAEYPTDATSRCGDFY